MPQGSLFAHEELSALTITLRVDRLNEKMLVLLVATTREGAMLASAGLSLAGWQEAELIPILLAEAGYGWLTGGSSDCTTIPAAACKARRKALTRVD